MSEHGAEKPTSKVDKAKKVGKVGWATLKVGGKVINKTQRTVRDTSTTVAQYWLGGKKYKRDIEDVSGRLSDALQRLDAVLKAKNVEIDQLREILRANGLSQ